MKTYRRKRTTLKRRRNNKSQKLWNMKGCANKSKKCMRGGKVIGADFNLAYTGNNSASVSANNTNPYLAFTGSNLSNSVLSQLAPTKSQLGGRRNRRGGTTCPTCPPSSSFSAYPGPQRGGCTSCASNTSNQMRGGAGIVPFPLPGFNQQPNAAWSGSNSPGTLNNTNATQLGYNTYKSQPDLVPSIQERDIYIPSIGGGKKLKRSRNNRLGKRGGISNVFSLMGTDVSNAYNTITGFPSSPSPMPYQGQFASPPQDNLAYLRL